VTTINEGGGRRSLGDKSQYSKECESDAQISLEAEIRKLVESGGNRILRRAELERREEPCSHTLIRERKGSSKSRKKGWRGTRADRGD